MSVTTGTTDVMDGIEHEALFDEGKIRIIFDNHEDNVEHDMTSEELRYCKFGYETAKNFYEGK